RKNNKLDAMKLLGEAGIPAGAVLDTDELDKDVTFEQRGIMQTMVHPVHRPFKMPGWPVRVDGRPTRVTPSPMLGEHTEHVLSDWLGLTGEAGAALKADGTLGPFTARREGISSSRAGGAKRRIAAPTR